MSPNEEELFMELLREKVGKSKVKSGSKTKKGYKPIPQSDSDSDSDEDILQLKRSLVKKAKEKKSTKQVDHLAKAREKKKLLAEEKKRLLQSDIKSQVKGQMSKKLDQTGSGSRTKVVTPKVKTIEASERELEREHEKAEQEEEKERLMEQYMSKYSGIFG